MKCLTQDDAGPFESPLLPRISLYLVMWSKNHLLNSRTTGNYAVTIETGNHYGAGTDSTVLLTIQGTVGSTELQFSGVGTFFDGGRYRKRLELSYQVLF